MGAVKTALRRIAIVVALTMASILGAVVAGIGGREPVSGNFAADPSPSSSTDPSSAGGLDAHAPDPVAPAFTPEDTAPLSKRAHGWRWAPVRREVVARTQPRPRALAVTRLRTRTPEGTQNIVAVLGRTTRAGRLWIRVRVPGLPDRSVGWIPRRALGGYGFVRTRLVVDLGDQRARLYFKGVSILQASIGVGKARWPTPTGTFYIRNRLTRYSDPFYGPLAFGTSARSGAVTDWPGGGFIGIHGTNRPDLLPGRVSHGCIRMSNADILKLGRLMPVGTPVVIRR
jgi:hypothetical protein